MAGAQAGHERFGAEHLGGDPGRFKDRAAGEGHIDVAGSDSVEEIGQPHPLQVDSYLRCFGGEQIDQVGASTGAAGGVMPSRTVPASPAATRQIAALAAAASSRMALERGRSSAPALVRAT